MSTEAELDYDYLMRNALRMLMRDVLSLVAELGDAPGEHHFFIEFLTDAPGVVLPDFLKESYPERMTVVLQHQFENLVVTDDGFSVSLWFKGKRADLTIPYLSVLNFADPSVEFGLRFNETDELDEEDATKEAPPPPPAADKAENEETPDDAEPSGDGADIVSLDQFRKK
ncbi:MAG: ClpXP protease specificity-enhancing factor SspB [Pseudomonadota bacterium]